MKVASLFALPAIGSPAVVRAPHAEATLIAEVVSVSPGDSFRAALRLVPEKHWHVYWSNPGDAGLPPELKWSLPEGFAAGPLEFPYPERIETPPLAAFGYGEEVWYTAWIRVSPTVRPGKATLRVQAKWLICHEVCLQERADLEFTLEIGKTRLDSARIGAWREALRKLPAQAPGWKWRAKFAERDLDIVGEKPSGWNGGLGRVFFFPSDQGVIENAERQWAEEKGRRLILILARDPVQSIRPDTLRGVLVSDSGWSDAGGERRKAIWVSMPASEQARKTSFSIRAAGIALLAALIALCILLWKKRRSP